MVSGAFHQLEVGREPARVYASGPDRTRRVVVFHAWWGLNDDVIAYVDRLASAGFSVVAPDLVRGRTASTIADAETLSSSIDTEHADAVALAAIDRLANSDAATRVGTVGFSMGVPWAIWCGAQRPAVVASVAYYGTVGGPSLAQASAPVLGHFAEADPYEPQDALKAFERALIDAGRRVAFHSYPGTGHWFAEPSQSAWRPEAADLAFDRTVAFLTEHLDRASDKGSTPAR